MKLALIILAFAITFPQGKVKPVKIKPEKSISIKVAEPSDIAFSASSNSYFVVSDNGLLYELDTEGKVKREADFRGYDFEAVWCNDANVYVVSEMSRSVYRFDKANLKLQNTSEVPYSGGRNKGFEAITYNEKRGRYVMVTEADPIYIFELDADFTTLNRIEFKGSRDISAATWHEGKLWLLSDEDMLIFRLDPESYEVEASWKIPVLNPEGLAFDDKGNMLVVADDLERLYYFKKP